MDILKNKTVLLADDDLDMITQPATLGIRYECVAVESQKKQKHLLKQKPDIAIYDLMMENSTVVSY